MDTPLESRAAAIARIRALWYRKPGAYWKALREAKLGNDEVFPEHVVTQPVVLPDFDKPDSTSKKKGKA